MSGQKDSQVLKTDIHCKTMFSDGKWNITWTLENFSLCTTPTGNAITSSIFDTGLDENGVFKWYLTLYPNGKANYNGYVGIFLCSSFDSPNTKTNVKYSFAILNNKNEQTNVQSNTYNFAGKVSSGFDQFVTRSYILNEANGVLQNDILKIYCGIEISLPSLNCVISCSYESKLIKLSEDLNALYNSGNLSDVIIKVGDKDFAAHKAILASRSAVFAAMFEHPLEESKRNVVEIADTEPELMKELLCFVYSGKAPRIKDFAADILPVADKYCIEELKKMAENILLGQLTVYNAAATLVLADTYNAPVLKEETIKFINLHGKAVMNTCDWNLVIARPSLVLDVYSALFDKCVVANKNIELNITF